MTKSSVRNAAAKKARGTDRKTAAKAVAEKARGTYRKTAAQLEEFARDAQMPESVRALAEKNVAQTQALQSNCGATSVDFDQRSS
jgi:hypothetical protein